MQTEVADEPGGSASLGHHIRGFAVIGVVSTVAHAVLYTLLRAVASPALANGIALLVTAIGNTAANRRLTFGVRGRTSLLRDHLAGLTAFGVALGITTVAVTLLEVVVPSASRATELLVLLAANAVATIVRFLLLRSWIRPGEVGPVRRTSARPTLERINR